MFHLAQQLTRFRTKDTKLLNSMILPNDSKWNKLLPIACFRCRAPISATDSRSLSFICRKPTAALQKDCCSQFRNIPTCSAKPKHQLFYEAWSWQLQWHWQAMGCATLKCHIKTCGIIKLHSCTSYRPCSKNKVRNNQKYCLIVVQICVTIFSLSSFLQRPLQLWFLYASVERCLLLLALGFPAACSREPLVTQPRI